jgi:DNA polymerase-3 subunit gamma/tau
MSGCDVVPPGCRFKKMSYLALARKYRPKQFTDMVGQSHVAQTLLNAFKQNKVGHAYLFTGTRGVGKTSAARILAKALRCEAANAGVPCDKCQSCIEINNGTSLDVLEIDGASNNGVENVREIRENVKFMPARGKLKVYIIDEVHMLTGAAFNALLKTLEEPPPHITFVLATTEVQKIPATILSRCQRFDFKRVPLILIQEHLARLAEQEGIKAENQALRMIARKAEGSMRDALSTLDQVLALSDKTLTAKNVSDTLGILGTDFLIHILGFSFQNKPLEAAKLLREAFESGTEMKLLAVELANTLRNAVFVKLGADKNLAEIGDDERAELKKLVDGVSLETLQAAFKLVSSSIEEISRSQLPRAALEMVLVRMASLSTLVSLGDLLMKAGSAAPTLEKKKNLEPVVAAPVTQKTSTDFSWKGWVEFVTKNKPSLGTLLEHAVLLEQTDDKISIGFRKDQSFFQAQAQSKSGLSSLESLVKDYSGVALKLDIQTIADERAAPSIAESENTAKEKNLDSVKSQFLKNELATSTKEIFGAGEAEFDIDN